MTSGIYNLFPTPVSMRESWREPTIDERGFFADIQSKERKQNIGNTHTLDNYILDAPEMTELKKDLTIAINSYFQEVWKPKYNVKIYITISWVNYTEMGQYHHMHHHSNSAISGVYYIDTDESDKITFATPHQELLTMRVHPQEWNIWNSDEWYIHTPKNSLVLFPSTLHHMVSPTTNPRTRVSLSFNTFFEGRLNDELQEITLTSSG